MVRGVNKWIPSEVVLNGLALPTAPNILTLQGTTCDARAANRWWHSMLRSELVDPSADPTSVVQISNQGTPGEAATGANPKMAYPVTLTIHVDPKYLTFLAAPPLPPDMGGTGGGPGRGSGGGPGAAGGRPGGGPGMGMRGLGGG